MYTKKFCCNWFMRKIIALSRRSVDFFDSFTDRKICGISLSKYVPSYAEGSTGSQSTPYGALEVVYGDADLKSGAAFMDVGCGKGRVLAFLIKKGCGWRLNGIELNPDVAKVAIDWTAKYPGINVSCGDAFNVDYNDYDILNMSRPFEPELFHRFIEMLESTLTHPIKLYYWVEQQSGSYLSGRKGWEMLRRETVFFRHGFFVAGTPQRYSVWTYTPGAER